MFLPSPQFALWVYNALYCIYKAVFAVKCLKEKRNRHSYDVVFFLEIKMFVFM